MTHLASPPRRGLTIEVEGELGHAQGLRDGDDAIRATEGPGDLTTTDGDDFFLVITKNNGFSHLHVVALQ